MDRMTSKQPHLRPAPIPRAHVHPAFAALAKAQVFGILRFWSGGANAKSASF